MAETNALQHLFNMLTNTRMPNGGKILPGGDDKKQILPGATGQMPVIDPRAWTSMGAGQFTPGPTQLSKGGQSQQGGQFQKLLSAMFGK